MINRVFRILWRCLIFMLGAVSLWAVVTYFIPFVDSRIPLFFALLATYCLLAYIVIPALIRLFRLVIKPNHIPHYTTSGDGWPADPVNIAVIAKNKKSLIRAMAAAGWYQADEMNFKNGMRGLKSFVFNKPYPTAPFSNLYLFDKKQDIGFQISTNRALSMRTRHHVRFWRLEEPRHESKYHPHLSFWQHKLSHLFGSKKTIWIGAAIEDNNPIDIQWYTGRLTHGVNHDTDRERDFIIQTLRDAQHIRHESITEAGESLSFRGQQFRTIYITDGSLKVIELK